MDAHDTEICQLKRRARKAEGERSLAAANERLNELVAVEAKAKGANSNNVKKKKGMSSRSAQTSKEVEQLRTVVQKAQEERDAATANEAALQLHVDELTRQLFELQGSSKLANELMAAQTEKIQSLETGNAVMQTELDQSWATLRGERAAAAAVAAETSRQLRVARDEIAISGMESA